MSITAAPLGLPHDCPSACPPMVELRPDGSVGQGAVIHDTKAWLRKAN